MFSIYEPFELICVRILNTPESIKFMEIENQIENALHA